MSQNLAAKFTRALRGLECERDLQSVVEIFSDDCQLSTPTSLEEFHGRDGARRFWRKYADTFSEVKSEILSTIASESHAALEWRLRGKVKGSGVDYRGVTLLNFAGDKISSLRLYFDPNSLAEQMPAASKPPRPDVPSSGTDETVPLIGDTA